MISYEPLWKTIKEKDISYKLLCHQCKISKGTLQRLQNNKVVSLKTIEKLCHGLDCKISDVVIHTKN